MSSELNLKNEILSDILEISDSELFFFSLFEFSKYKKINGGYIFSFANEKVINLVMDYILKYRNNLTVDLLEKGKKKYVFLHGKPSYSYSVKNMQQISDEFYGNESKIIDLLKLILVFCGYISKIKSSNNSIEFITNYTNIKIVVNLLMLIRRDLPKIIEKNGKEYVYFKTLENFVIFFTYIKREDLSEKLSEIRKNFKKESNSKIHSNNEINNLNKTVKVTTELIERVIELKKTREYDDLPQIYKNLIELKISNPELSFSELSKKLEELNGIELNKQKIAYIVKKLK